MGTYSHHIGGVGVRSGSLFGKATFWTLARDLDLPTLLSAISNIKFADTFVGNSELPKIADTFVGKSEGQELGDPFQPKFRWSTRGDPHPSNIIA